jgi:Glycosyl transferase family 11
VIAVECRGRLGNQMFQYAFGLAASHLLDTQLAIDADELARVFALPSNGKGDASTPTRVVRVPSDGYGDPEAVLAGLTDETTYEGYFQSERFFAPTRNEVRAAFRVRDEHVANFRGAYADLVDRDYVCCHMRRTDYHTFAGGVALPMAYYQDALEQIAVPDGTPIVFVGDDLDEAHSAFASRENVRFERNDIAVDHLLLRNAAIAIVSNSSFAWWGAWLNERATVIAPRLWLGFDFGWEYPPHVIPPVWTQVRVRRPWRRRLAPAHVRMSLGRKRRDMASQVARRLGRAPSVTGP